MGLEKAVEQVYRGRERMIIIGLTGRTGSGCTKVAEILQKEHFFDLDLPDTKKTDYADAEERKDNIIKDFMEMDGHWKKFDVIEMSSIILAAVLEQGKEAFVGYLNTITLENEKATINIGEKAKLIDDINEMSYMFEEAQKVPLIEDEIEGKDCDNYYEFYIKKIKEYKISFKSILDNYTCFEVKRSRLKGKQQKRYHLYTYLMQEMGNNLRSSGNPFEKKFCESKFRDFFRRVNKIIDIINKRTENVAKENNEVPSTRICIDAIRNPYEALYFKDKYKSFRLMAISTDDEDRRKRLKELNDEELDNLDNVEYATKLKKPEEVFYHQNIQGCLEVADIHVYNEDIENGKYHNLTKQIIKYIALMLHPALVTPTHIERCMQLAYNAKYNSGCLSRQVGAVVTRGDYSVQSIGWNDVPKGQVSCNLRDISSFCTNKDAESFSNYEIEDDGFNSIMDSLNTKMKGKVCGRCKAFCFKDVYNGMKNEKNQVYTRALHAEENAFLQISKYGGTAVNGGYLFTTYNGSVVKTKIKDFYNELISMVARG
jgi:dCMP deaminase